MTEGTRYKTEEDVFYRAKEAIGIPMWKIDKTGRILTGKGAIGTIIEESWFGYKPNNDANPDFPEAGVELKVTPYLHTKKGEISAKERLILTIINYMEEWKKTFEDSDFWHKSKRLVIMFYEHRKGVRKKDFVIDEVILFSFPEEDRVMIKQDWEKIISRIKAGEAHLISERDTLYLAACPKGETSATKRQQPFSTEKAMQRAYSLKQRYMTRILRRYVFGAVNDEHIVKDLQELEKKGLERYILDKLSPYYGKTKDQLKGILGVTSSSKHVNSLLLAKMLDLKGKDVDKTAEFQNAGIELKTISVLKNGHVKESMSFPTFKFKKIVKETWKKSEFRNHMESTRFLFAIFRENGNGEYFFERAMFWNMPAEDLEEVRRVWERTASIIREGVKFHPTANGMGNNLPKMTESPVAHVRPHARDTGDTYPLPGGGSMPKQCFWLNRSYIERIIDTSEQ